MQCQLGQMGPVQSTPFLLPPPQVYPSPPTNRTEPTEESILSFPWHTITSTSLSSKLPLSLNSASDGQAQCEAGGRRQDPLLPSGTCPEQESREPGPWQTEGVPSTKISLSSLRQPEPASWCLVAPLCLARAPACQRSAWMTTNMAAPVDRQRLGRRGPLAVGPGNVSWPAEVEGKAALKKAASSCTIWHFFELTQIDDLL